MRRHWLVAALPVILFVAVAIVLGLKRPVTLHPTANLSVGHVYVSNPAGIPTIIDATKSLAAVYSRAIHSSAVVQDTRRRCGARTPRRSPAASRPRRSPEPADQGLGRVAIRPGAIALANAGAAALAAYVNRQVRDNDASDDDLCALSAGLGGLPPEPRHEQASSRAATPTIRPRANRAARERAAAATDTARAAP